MQHSCQSLKNRHCLIANVQHNSMWPCSGPYQQDCYIDKSSSKSLQNNHLLTNWLDFVTLKKVGRFGHRLTSLDIKPEPFYKK